MTTTFKSDFAVKDEVYIDGDNSMRARVTAVLFRNENPQCEVSWINDSARTAWIEAWRLTKWVG